MNKRQMKKKIPKDTHYCLDCPHKKFLGFRDLNRKNCKYAEVCDSDGGCDCRIHIYRCNYLKFTDHEEETLLWDGCKECGEGLVSEKRIERELVREQCELQGLPTHRGRFKK